jgi:hypothetical protein
MPRRLANQKSYCTPSVICPDVGQISLINSHRFIPPIRSSKARNRLRRKANFLSGIQSDVGCRSSAKIFRVHGRQCSAINANALHDVLSTWS